MARRPSVRAERRRSAVSFPTRRSASLAVAVATAWVAMYPVAPTGAHPSALSDDGPSALKLRQHIEYDGSHNLEYLPDGGLVSGALSEGGRVDDAGLRLFDVDEVGHATVAAFARCPVSNSYVAVHPGVVAMSVERAEWGDCAGLGIAGRTGVILWNASSSALRPVAFIPLLGGVHTIAALPGTRLFYGSGDYALRIIDATDPTSPLVTSLNYATAHPLALTQDASIPSMANESGKLLKGPNCHEIGFDAERRLAFCAAFHEVQIWDIRDPLAPRVIGVIDNERFILAHSAEVAPGGRILMVSDEGGLSAGCYTRDAHPGAVWFYDVSDPRAPVLLDSWAPQFVAAATLCTSHNFGFFANRPWVSVAWYEHGVFVLDFADPTDVRLVAAARLPATSFDDVLPLGNYLYATSISPISMLANFVPDALDADPRQEKKGGLYVFELPADSKRATSGSTAPFNGSHRR